MKPGEFIPGLREVIAGWNADGVDTGDDPTIQIVMITIAVIAAVIGTTELLFELLDSYERKQHDRNNSQRPSL